MSNRRSRSTKQNLDFQRLEPRKLLASVAPVDTAVVGRYVFYNDSAFDSNSTASNVADYGAIATDKVALLPGETATYDNITNYSKGINGIIIDANLADASAFSAADLELSTSVASDLSNLTPLNVTPVVTVRPGDGVGGSDRITIILPNSSVTDEYLQVKLLSSSATGLFSDDVFYFGNVIGDTGDTASNTRVDGSDIGGVQSALTDLFTQANIDSHFDINRDRRIDGSDIGLVQGNLTDLFSTVPLATAPAAVTQAAPVLGNEFFVSSRNEFNSALNQVQPGDSIVLRNGVYTNQHFEFSAVGTEELPITFRAETPGQVVLNGSSRLSISGDWLVVDGLNFDGGALDGGSIVEFRGDLGDATNSRFTNSAITDYNPSNESTRYFWVSLYGQNNRVDHNEFSGQAHSGVTVVVWRSNSDPDFHLIDNNHFRDRPEATGGANGYETIRIGTSGQSLSDSFTTVESNLFERTDGEIEIISVKSGRNTIRNNTFLESAGTLTLRHGTNNVVEGNYFIGNGKDRSGGVRIIDDGHIVVNNYFEGLDGRAGGAISISAAVDDANQPLNAHAPVENVLIANNTIVDLNNGAAIEFSEGLNNNNGAGARTLLADNVTIANNLISTTRDTLFDGDEGTNFTFENNIAFGASLGSVSDTSGFIFTNPQLTRDADGLLRLTSNSPAIDAAFASFASATGGIDIEGQARGASFDIGADEFSTAPATRGPLTADDVGNCFHEFDGVTPVNPNPTPNPEPGTPTGLIVNDGLVIQAEQFAVVLDPNDDEDSFTIVSNNDSYGGSAVRAPEGSRVDLDQGEVQDAVLVYNLKFEESGTYRVYYRARGADGSSNSFYTPTDFGAEPSITETISSDGNYRWDRGGTFEVSGADIESTVEFLLSKREADAEIDSIVFHRSSSLTDSQLDQLAFV